MQLIPATDDFKIANRPRPGFPILLWEDMSSCREVNEFFRSYLSRGAIGSHKSWTTISRALYDFFSFLEAHDLSWRDVDRGERKNIVAAYRDYCFETVKLARNTVRNRLVYVCAYFDFALKRGWIAEAQEHLDALFVGTDKVNGLQVRTLTAPRWNALLKNFVRDCGLTWDISTHQFRRKFANYAARSQFGDLRYLRDHFKHWSQDMTLGYAMNESQEMALYFDIEDELDDIKHSVVEGWIDASEPLAGGYGKAIVEWRAREENVVLFKSQAHMIRSIAETTAIRSNGHAWCTADDNLCVGNDFERTRCGDGCGNAVIGRGHAHIYQGMFEQMKTLALVADIGEGGRQRVRRDIDRSRGVLADLGYTPVEGSV